MAGEGATLRPVTRSFPKFVTGASLMRGRHAGVYARGQKGGALCGGSDVVLKCKQLDIHFDT